MTNTNSTRVHSESIADTIRAIAARSCGKKAVSDVDNLSRDLHCNGAARTELIMAIEVVFGVEFSASEIAAIATVGDVIGLVSRKIAIA